MGTFLALLKDRKWMFPFEYANQTAVTIRSSTVSDDQLNSLAEQIRTQVWCPVTVARITDVTDVCPTTKALWRYP